MPQAVALDQQTGAQKHLHGQVGHSSTELSQL